MQHMQSCIYRINRKNGHLKKKEHFRYIESKEPQSAYSLNVLNMRHEYGPQEEAMQLFKTCKWANTWTVGKPSIL